MRRPVLRMAADRPPTRRPDTLAVEEPMELRVSGRALAVTMRTPGHDVELAHGFLLTEGVITRPGDVATARWCDSVDDTARTPTTSSDVALAPGVAPPEAGVERNFYTTSSCGVCGKASLDAVRLRSRFPPAGDPVRLDGRHALRPARRVARRSGSSTPPAACTPPGLFTADGTRLRSARTSAGTTPSTRSWAGRCSTDASRRRAAC
jgi:FdhD protein